MKSKLFFPNTTSLIVCTGGTVCTQYFGFIAKVVLQIDWFHRHFLRYDGTICSTHLMPSANVIRATSIYPAALTEQ